MNRVDKALRHSKLSFREVKLTDTSNKKAPNPFNLSRRLFNDTRRYIRTMRKDTL